jgi:hypothetical protein
MTRMIFLGLLASSVAMLHLVLAQASRVISSPAWSDARNLISLAGSADRISQLSALGRLDRR